MVGIIKTDIRITQEAAKRLRFYPAAPLVATNVQDAIQQAAAAANLPAPTAVTIGMSPYTPTPSDTLLLVNTSAGAITIQMPLEATRQLDLEVKDITGNSPANPISVVRGGAEWIDGLTTYTIDSAYGAAKFGPKTGGYYVHA